MITFSLTWICFYNFAWRPSQRQRFSYSWQLEHHHHNLVKLSDGCMENVGFQNRNLDAWCTKNFAVYCLQVGGSPGIRRQVYVIIVWRRMQMTWYQIDARLSATTMHSKFRVPQIPTLMSSLKRKVDKFIITSCTESCHFDNFPCN